MKYKLSSMWILILAITQSACQTQNGTSPTSSQIKVVAHRGCLSNGPENSLPAIFGCFNRDIDIVETDIQLSADNTPIIIHDKTLDRTTNATGPVKSHPANVITELQLKEGLGGDAAELTDLSPPLLEDVLQSMRSHQLINLDVKDTKAYAPTNALLRKYKLGQSIILKTSMSPRHPDFGAFSNIGGALFMPVIRECQNDVKPSLEMHCVSSGKDILAHYGDYPIYGVELIFANESFLKEASDLLDGSDLEIWVNALAPTHAAGHTDKLALKNPDAHWGRLVELGATIIQTDYPAELKAYLGNRH